MCSKHVEDSNKLIIEETVCQVGYLPELCVHVLVCGRFKSSVMSDGVDSPAGNWTLLDMS
jgi:hypothetical protein